MQCVRKVVLRYRKVRNRHLTHQLGRSIRMGLYWVAVHMALDMALDIVAEVAAKAAVCMMSTSAEVFQAVG